MQVDVLRLDETTGVFDIRGATPAFLNAIRRTLLGEVRKLALDEITIYDNTSALFDEMVANRLGLVPIPTDLADFPPGSTAGTREEPILFTLSKEGPCTVYSGDLVPAMDAKFKIRDPRIPIVKLLEGQRIMLEAGAILGTGHEHAKWQAANAVGYEEYPTVKVGPGGILPATLEKIQRTAPAGSVQVEGDTIRILDPVKAATYLRSVRDLYDLDNVEIGYERDRFVFTIETDGALPPLVAMREAISIVMEKLRVVENEAPKLKPLEVEQ